MAESILLVEDDHAIAAVVIPALERDGFRVTWLDDGARAIEYVATTIPDLAILDLLLPGANGWEILAALRERTDRPVIMLTACGGEDNTVSGLDRGADDYMAKPFSIIELVARVRAALRRAAQESTPGRLSLGGVVLDELQHEVRVDDKLVPLSPREFDLLAHLMKRAGEVQSRTEILHAVWGRGEYLDERTVDVHIRWLRTKIEADPARPRRLLTLRGTGYVFATQL